MEELPLEDISFEMIRNKLFIDDIYLMINCLLPKGIIPNTGTLQEAHMAVSRLLK